MHGSDFHEVPFLNCEIRALKTGVKVREVLIWPYSGNQNFKYFLLHFHIYFKKTKYVVFIFMKSSTLIVKSIVPWLRFSFPWSPLPNCEIHGPLIKRSGTMVESMLPDSGNLFNCVSQLWIILRDNVVQYFYV